MRNLMLSTILIFSITIVGTSQVKEKFRDRANTSTIVVIKDDKAIDTDLLDQHFDLSSMSMSDQIMITTKPEEPSLPEASPLPKTTSVPEAPEFGEATTSINDDVDIFFEEFEQEKEDKETISTTKEKESNLSKNSIEVASKVKSTPRRATGNYPSKSGYEVKKAAQKKYYAKSKIKKSKRKKRRLFGKKKSSTCYSF